MKSILPNIISIVMLVMLGPVGCAVLPPPAEEEDVTHDFDFNDNGLVDDESIVDNGGSEDSVEHDPGMGGEGTEGDPGGNAEGVEEAANEENSSTFGLILGRVLLGRSLAGGPLEILSTLAVFGSVDNELKPPDFDRETVGPCVVGVNEDGEINDASEVPTGTLLDAGFPATLDHGDISLELNEVENGYGASSDTLVRYGFAPGQEWMISFPGGDDIQGFVAKILVPGRLAVLSPDLADPTFKLDLTSDLVLQWSTEEKADMVQISMRTSRDGQSASISCEFEDMGTATIPQAALAYLVVDATVVEIDVYRRNIESIEAPLRAGGSLSVQIIGETATPHSFTFLSNPGFCQFITCQVGLVCNLTTRQCE